jgi:hypothetical protein
MRTKKQTDIQTDRLKRETNRRSPQLLYEYACKVAITGKASNVRTNFHFDGTIRRWEKHLYY